MLRLQACALPVMPQGHGSGGAGGGQGRPGKYAQTCVTLPLLPWSKSLPLHVQLAKDVWTNVLKGGQLIWLNKCKTFMFLQNIYVSAKTFFFSYIYNGSVVPVKKSSCGSWKTTTHKALMRKIISSHT